MKNYDFSGWATRNNIRCSDGKTIIKDAFKGNDGQIVPLVWNHQHNEATNVLGHALLENRNDGVYAYCTFNDTESGQNAKLLVQHGDISALSIYANKLKQQAGNVIHGVIREVSLVLGGANPGAYIESVMAHGEESDEEAVIYTGEPLDLSHSDTPNKKQEGKKDDMATKEKTVGEVFDELTEEQKTVVYALIGQALEDQAAENQNDDSEGGSMKQNVFEGDNASNALTHADMVSIFTDAKRCGSLKDAVLAHGIDNIDYLFPDAKNIDTPPSFIQRDMGWVKKVMGSVHHTPFSRIKSTLANITADEARAKGYIKGNEKTEEVFTLLKRSTTPTTIYKKQRLDRDDIVDITDFDVVAWLKAEMRLMLDEEIARAILTGDGRLTSSDDKINEQNVRPIWKDDDLYSIKIPVTVTASMTDDLKTKAAIRAIVKARKNYKGSGNPSLYATEDFITDCLLLEDNNGRIIYESVEKLATALRVKEVISVPVMENLTRTDSTTTYTLAGIIANLTDYAVGADKGGAVNMFDDFDIDYNAQKYLIETRCSGALRVPYSAIVVEFATTTTQANG
jgi:hypothetical protein